MGYRFCGKKAMPPTIHKNDRPPDCSTTLEEDLYLYLSSDVDFDRHLLQCDPELSDDDDLESLELGYPDDSEDDSGSFHAHSAPENSTKTAAEAPHLSPPFRPPANYCTIPTSSPQTTEPFSDELALVEALYTQFRVFLSDMNPPVSFTFHGTYAANLRPGASLRETANALRTHIAARCALRFNGSLPAAPLASGGIVVRSVCAVRRTVGVDTALKSPRAILDVSVTPAQSEWQGRYTITVQFRVVG
ncbi:hypothetical protein DFH06DRAFT_722748 [Mycena polygramma]|nr:hypothetical protein DFH06DRAFT_722748 [Mycena polygramma]